MDLIFSNTDTLAYAGIGALIQELLHWYGLRHKLSNQEYGETLKSTGYWVITILVIIVTPLAVVVWFGDRTDTLRPGDMMILGAAFPTLFKTVVARVGEGDGPKLGGTRVSESVGTSNSSILKSYLRGR